MVVIRSFLSLLAKVSVVLCFDANLSYNFSKHLLLVCTDVTIFRRGNCSRMKFQASILLVSSFIVVWLTVELVFCWFFNSNLSEVFSQMPLIIYNLFPEKSSYKCFDSFHFASWRKFRNDFARKSS